MAELIIIRGLPGSGKSTLATKLVQFGGYHFEADMYFMVDGVYKFDVTLLHLAHQWCINQTALNLVNKNLVVVSNTFTTIKELRPYFNLAKAAKITPTVILAQNQFSNVHGVPDEAMKRMRDRFAYDISELYE